MGLRERFCIIAFSLFSKSSLFQILCSKACGDSVFCKQVHLVIGVRKKWRQLSRELISIFVFAWERVLRRLSKCWRIFTNVKRYRECKLLSGFVVSGMAWKVPKTTNAVAVQWLPAPRKKASAAVRENRQQIICQIAKSFGISEVTCQRILTEDFNMYRMCQHIFPLTLNEDKKAIPVKMVGDLISAVDKDRWQNCYWR